MTLKERLLEQVAEIQRILEQEPDAADIKSTLEVAAAALREAASSLPHRCVSRSEYKRLVTMGVKALPPG